MYVEGRIILRNFFKTFVKKNYAFFLCISLGYILISSLIFLLGFIGFLSYLNVWLLILGLVALAVFDIRKNQIKVKLNFDLLRFEPVKYLVLGFILIAFLRLIPPQSAGDPLDYHLRFPRIYLHEHSMMLPPLGDESYVIVPQLPEMLFVISQVFTNGEASRIIHFGFFVLLCMTLYRADILKKRYKKAGEYSALLFASAPFILELGYQAFSDFPAILCVLLSLLILIEEQPSKRRLLLSGVLFGGALASKLWMLYYFPFLAAFVFLISKKRGFLNRIIYSLKFAAPALCIVFLWYLRGYLLKGNPFYVNTDQGRIDADYPLVKSFFQYLSFKGVMDRLSLPTDYGPFYLFGISTFIIGWILGKIKVDFKIKILLTIFVAASYVIPIAIASNRYSLPYMVFVLILSGIGFSIATRQIVIKSIVFAVFALLLVYYSINTLIILPYGLGWANKNSYLKRELIKDHASYYDYNGKFSEKIKPDSTIVTFGVSEMYYADFMYKNAYYFIDQKKKIINIPSTFKKFLIRGGDYAWFCEKVKVENCTDYDVELLTYDSQANQYLYRIKYK